MRLIAVILLIFSSLYINAQVFSESSARAELAKRGITEAQFRAEMLRRGINIDNIDPNNTQDLLRVEKEAREALEKLENENKKEAKKNERGKSIESDTTKLEAKDKLKGQDEKKDTLTNKNSEEARMANKSATEIKKAVERGASLEEAVAEKLQENQKENFQRLRPMGSNCLETTA